MLVTLPFLLLLLDFWPLQRTPFDTRESNPEISLRVPRMTCLQLVLEKIPLILLSAASSWMTLRAQRTVVRTFEEFSLRTRIENALVAYGLYLWKMLWPAKLAFYPHSGAALPRWEPIVSALTLIAVTALVAVFRSKRYLMVGWCWFLGTLVPVIGLVQVGEASMADRYAYVPLIGIFIMIAWGLADLADARRVTKVWRVIPAMCILATLSWITVLQIGYWESDYDLWAHTLELSETPFAHNALGTVLMNPESEMAAHDLESFASPQARMDEARRHFERALELRPQTSSASADLYSWDTARTLNNLGNLDRMQNRLDQARAHIEAALRIYRDLAQQNPDAYMPYLAAVLNNVGSIDRLQNRLDEGRGHFEEGLKIYRQLAGENPAKYLPNTAMVLNEFGMLDMAQNRPQEAHEHYAEALQIERRLTQQSPEVYLPQLAITLDNFGMVDAMQNRMEEARQHYEEALKIDRQLAERKPALYLPDIAMNLSNLGRVDQMENHIDESRVHYEEAFNLLQKLSQSDSRYAGGLASVEASLEELANKSAAR